MDATITLREGCPPDLANEIKTNPPANAPDAWLTRREAADKLQVGPRTIDRYLRRKQLSFYRGPVPGAGSGIRIWSADVASYPYRTTITVVAP